MDNESMKQARMPTEQDERIEELKNQVEILEKKNLELSDKAKDYARKANQAERVGILFDMLSKQILNDTPAMSKSAPKPTKQKRQKRIVETAGLHISDGHVDQLIPYEIVQGLERYDFLAACHRAAKIVDTVRDHITVNLARTYAIEDIYVFVGGDMSSGGIHGLTKHTEWRNACKGAIAAGELIAYILSDIASFMRNVYVVWVSGNHGRFGKRKDYYGAQENWDYISAIHAATRLQEYVNDGRIQFMVPNAWTAGVRVYDWNFSLNHGDDVKSWNSIPFYGIERRTRRLTALGALKNLVPNYHLLGHYHTRYEQQITTGEVMLNGSWPATDPYALESKAAFSRPMQNFFGVHPEKGISWRMPIYLRSNEWEKEERKSARYDVTIFQDLTRFPDADADNERATKDKYDRKG